jgi:hypothetical protein
MNIYVNVPTVNCTGISFGKVINLYKLISSSPSTFSRTTRFPKIENESRLWFLQQWKQTGNKHS